MSRGGNVLTAGPVQGSGPFVPFVSNGPAVQATAEAWTDGRPDRFPRGGRHDAS